MATVRAFPGMLFAQNDEVFMESHCCPPYDIISPALQAHLYDDLPHNAIRLELPRGEGDEKYQNARRTLDEWLEQGILKVSDKNALYIYEEEFHVPGGGGASVCAAGKRLRLRGLIARVKLEEFSRGVVLPHEDTLSKAKEDRFRLMKATGCNFSQIYSLYLDEAGEVTPKIDELAAGQPDLEFVYEDGITHRLWIVEDEAAIAAVCGGFADKKLYIADGHHRYETALRYRDELRAGGGDAGAAENVMMMLVDLDSAGLVVLPTHRELVNLPDFDALGLLKAIEQDWEVTPVAAEALPGLLDTAADITCGLITGETAWLLSLREGEEVGYPAMARALPEKSAAYRSLDVAALHTLILEPVLGIDQKNMSGGQNLIYTHSADEAMRDAAEGRAQAAFLIRPTRVRQIREVAQAGEKMPQKSTYFYPKILTGLVFNKF